MKSMTGFGYREHRDEKRHIIMTLKSYNNRFLDIIVYLPSNLAVLEQKIRQFLSSKIHRGRVELYVKATELGPGGRIDIDTDYVSAYVEALKRLADTAGIRDKVRLSHLLRIEGILNTEQSPNLEEYWLDLQPVLESVFEEFEQTRQREGEATRKDVESLLTKIDAELSAVEALSPRLEEKIKVDLRSRFEELLGSGMDESRVLAETAVILMKYDVHEEIIRARSHLKSFRETLEEGGAVGKKLDFICQELNREFNTIGAKNLLLEVDGSVVVLKDTVEKIREQLRNVE
jgi:uncharacterized protein (TIGR00255 family)